MEPVHPDERLPREREREASNYLVTAVLFVLSSIIALAAGCGKSGPCAEVGDFDECAEDTECSDGRECWCGVCTPASCVGPLDFGSGLDLAVREETGIEGDIYYVDVRGLDYLGFGGDLERQVYCLDGVQCCVNLERLYLPDNYIAYLSPLEGLEHLSSLVLSHNSVGLRLDTLPSLPALAVLDISHNDEIFDSDLRELPDLPSLTELDISYAEITDIETLSRFTTLESLDISWNNIDDISVVSELPVLKKLFASGTNNISDISALESCERLDELVVRENSVSSISPLSSLVEISVIDLYGNEVSELNSLVENTGLGEGDIVNLGHNPIDCVEQMVNINALQERGVEIITGCQ